MTAVTAHRRVFEDEKFQSDFVFGDGGGNHYGGGLPGRVCGGA
jgi:hypothetical protein